MGLGRFIGRGEDYTPLPERIRPKNLDEFVGQRHLVGDGKPIRVFIEKKYLPSIILWGPPGVGKTTLAMILTKSLDSEFVYLTAVSSGVDKIREALKRANVEMMRGRRLIVFVDEFHRFNKSQQSIFLPYIERGDFILIASTTENPSFYIISPLLSRMEVFQLYPLSEDEILEILKRGVRELGVEEKEDFLRFISSLSQGDGRRALMILEFSQKSGSYGDIEKLRESLKELPLYHDKKYEEHYNLTSAFIKSMRGSDPDAALYWFFRLIEAGEDPLFLGRRMVILAAEDIGLADPQALSIAMSAVEAFRFLGAPEGLIPLAEAVVYLSLAPKSNSVYKAMGKAKEDVKKYGSLPVPLHLRNPETPFLKKMGYGDGYKYPHNYENHYVEQDYFPEKLGRRKYYEPSLIGKEKEIVELFKKFTGKK